MKERIQQLVEKIDALTLRERGIVLAAILAVIIMGCYIVLIEPLDKEKAKHEQELNSLDSKRNEISLQTQTLIQQRANDPNARENARIQQLEKQIQSLDLQIKALTANVVSPTQMTYLLENMLTQQSDLDLIRLESVDSVPLINESGKQTRTVDEEGMLYKHGMIIEVTGSYFDLLDFLKTIEGLEWSVLWDAVIIRQHGYPENTITLKLHTISQDKSWIGV